MVHVLALVIALVLFSSPLFEILERFAGLIDSAGI
jgi:hypothetical protein